MQHTICMTFNCKYALYSCVGVPSGNVVKVMMAGKQEVIMKTLKCHHSEVKCASHIAYMHHVKQFFTNVVNGRDSLNSTICI